MCIFLCCFFFVTMRFFQADCERLTRNIGLFRQKKKPLKNIVQWFRFFPIPVSHMTWSWLDIAQMKSLQCIESSIVFFYQQWNSLQRCLRRLRYWNCESSLVCVISLGYFVNDSYSQYMTAITPLWNEFHLWYTFYVR